MVAASPLETSSYAAFAAASTHRGVDLLYTRADNHLQLARYSAFRAPTGHVRTLPGTPVELTLATTGGGDMAVWREDFNGGSWLRGALVQSGGALRASTL